MQLYIVLLIFVSEVTAVRTQARSQQFDPMSIVMSLLQSILGVGNQMNEMGASEEAAKAALEDQLRDEQLADAVQNGTSLAEIEAMQQQQAQAAELEKRAQEVASLGAQATASLAKAVERSEESIKGVSSLISNAVRELKSLKESSPPPLTDVHEPGIIQMTVKYPVEGKTTTMSPDASAIKDAKGDVRETAKINIGALKVPVVALFQESVVEADETKRMLDDVLYHLEKYPASSTSRTLQKELGLSVHDRAERLSQMIASLEAQREFFKSDREQTQRIFREEGRGDELAAVLEAAKEAVEGSNTLGIDEYLGMNGASEL